MNDSLKWQGVGNSLRKKLFSLEHNDTEIN